MASFFDYPTGDGGAPAEEDYFLAQCSEDDWAALLKHTRSRRVRAGEAVIQPGETDRALYIVREGTLEAVVPQGRRGKIRRLATFEPGTVIGELSFLDGRPRSALVRATTDAELVGLSLEQFEVLAGIRPVLARTILFELGRILAGRLRRTQTLLATAIA